MTEPLPDPERPNWKDRAFVALQKLLPTLAISGLMHRLAYSRKPWILKRLLPWYIRRYGVIIEEAEFVRLESYDTFSAFFTRALKPGLRPMPEAADALACPADGMLAQRGDIGAGQLILAKGRSFDVTDLLGDPATAARFAGGSFATIYLAPGDYHRVHMPLDGQLAQWTYVPGRLFSVNPSTVRALPDVFWRNERVAAVFDTGYGPLAMVLVGAMCVGGIETVWSGRMTPPHHDDPEPQIYQSMETIRLARGAEMGRFNLGSTVILLLGRHVQWSGKLAIGAKLRMGQSLATLAAAKIPA